MKIYSWNVNGLRACARKGFGEWLGGSDADIVGLQEVRARSEQLEENVRAPEGWFCHFVPAQRPGYSGVALYSREKPQKVETSLGVDDFDCEGRLQWAQFTSLNGANVYFPNGSGKNRDNSRIPFKLNFYRALHEQLNAHFVGTKPVIVMGDFNTAHEEIDLARPKQNHKTSGFCLEEREELSRWIEGGWTDSFRCFTEGNGHYTWWSNRKGVRERNVGWRIDYVLVNKAARQALTNAFICPDVMGSDHCPIGVELEI